MPMACVLTRPSHTNAAAYIATPATTAVVTANVAVVSPRNARYDVAAALAAMNGPAIVTVARNFGTAIFHRGTGEMVRLASVRSSTSLPNAAAAIASTTSGAIEPDSIALRTETSNWSTVGASGSLSIAAAMMTGSAASTNMITMRHLPESWRSVRR